jgi:hypothetical protein
LRIVEGYVFYPSTLSEVQTELEQSQASQEQDAATPSQACDARCKSEAISKKAIGDIAKIDRAMSSTMAGLGVSLGPQTPETLIEEVGAFPAWCGSSSC